MGLIEAYKGTTHKKLVSRVYSYIQCFKKHSSLQVKLNQENQENMTLTEEEWSNMSSELHHHQLQPMERIFMEAHYQVFYYIKKKILTNWQNRIWALLETV